MDKKDLQNLIHKKTIKTHTNIPNSRIFSKPDDWELYFLHRCSLYQSQQEIEKQYNCKISFTIQTTKDSIQNINPSADIIVIVAKEDYVIENQKLYEQHIGRPMDQVILLSDVLLEGTVFDLSNPKCTFAGTWLCNPVNAIPNVNKIKPYLFDALIGRRHKHYDKLWNQLQPIKDKMLYRYRNESNLDDYDEPLFLRRLNELKTSHNIDSDNWVYEEYGSWTTFDIEHDDWIKQFGPHSLDIHNAWMCRITPNTIYDNSMASIVRECKYWYCNLFLTEKTAKPLQTKRLWFALGGYKYNTILKQLGFKPYGNYEWDTIEDIDKRIEVFADTMYNLNTDKIFDMYETYAEDIEHNYKITNQNWAQKNLDFIKSNLV